MKRRIISAFLATVIIFGLIPTIPVFADDEPVVHSKVSFVSDEFYTCDGVDEISVKRDEALYSYVTAMVRTIENGGAKEGENYSHIDTKIEFRPYQDEATFEIPVSANEDMSFTVELYDLKGGEDGNYMSAQVNLDAKESGLLAIPVKGEEKHYTKDGIMELMLTVNSGETSLIGTICTKQFTKAKMSELLQMTVSGQRK